ncbi:solute carrier organic anion transporter family member 74D-like isoform X2 [Artemia franciscana]|uniref:solute carrier organic anion transporter family member 74D-like isoform X2 n=1 Tax=Artemia franciscana TaxID=6661 RepID=UPI0032DBC149
MKPENKNSNTFADVNFVQVNELGFDDDSNNETTCGIGPFQGKWLQKFANKKTYILVYSIVGTLQSMFFTYFVAVLTTVEKQFRFKSRTSGLSNSTSLCSSLTNSQSGNCILEENTDSWVPAMLLFLSQFVSGIGSTMFYTLGIPYLDDNTKKKQAPMLLGITSSLRLFGPTLGFVLASACLRLYVNVTEKPLFGTTDPKWIGAWWLGFVVVGICLIPAAALISCFPRKLPQKRLLPPAVTYRQVGKMPRRDVVERDETPKLKDFPTALKRLLSNKILMLNNIGGLFVVFAISGYITFLPKYMQVQFQQTAVTASILNGIVGILFMAAGLLVGGYVISKKQPSAFIVQVYITLTGFLFTIGFAIFAFFGCNLLPMHGIHGENGIINTTTECNSHCECVGTRYSPVCSEDGQMNFFSACHAGCDQFTVNRDGKKQYSNCSCLAFVNSTYWTYGDVVEGVCDAGCQPIFYMYLVATGIMQFVAGTARVGGTIINFRCVQPNDKAFALGLTTFLFSIFAFIPAPIFYGALIDQACWIWDKDECGKEGHCWLYDPEKMRIYLHLITAGCFFIGIFVDVAICRLVKDLKLFEDSEVEIKSTTYAASASTPVDEFISLAKALED